MQELLSSGAFYIIQHQLSNILLDHLYFQYIWSYWADSCP